MYIDILCRDVLDSNDLNRFCDFVSISIPFFRRYTFYNPDGVNTFHTGIFLPITVSSQDSPSDVDVILVTLLLHIMIGGMSVRWELTEGASKRSITVSS